MSDGQELVGPTHDVPPAVTDELSDDDRYVQHLQEQLLTDDGWRPVLERLRSQPAPSLPKHLRDSDSEGILRRWNAFEPATQYDLPATHAIFQPILDDIAAAAVEIGLRPVADIRLATSTEMVAGPIARPGSGGHLLFVGPGTSAFCNYWAKALAWHYDSVGRAIGSRPISSRLDTQAALRLDAGPLALALKLALRYATAGSVVGVGVVQIPETAQVIRHELLMGMETFAVAHEYCHFVAEEQRPDLTGHDLEMFCDALGLVLARNAPSQQSNWSNFVGAGAIAFFAVSAFCEKVKRLIWPPAPRVSDSHPQLRDRIAAITKTVDGTTDVEQRATVNGYVNDLVVVLDNFFHECREIASLTVGSPGE